MFPCHVLLIERNISYFCQSYILDVFFYLYTMTLTQTHTHNFIMMDDGPYIRLGFRENTVKPTRSLKHLMQRYDGMPALQYRHSTDVLSVYTDTIFLAINLKCFIQWWWTNDRGWMYSTVFQFHSSTFTCELFWILKCFVSSPRIRCETRCGNRWIGDGNHDTSQNLGFQTTPTALRRGLAATRIVVVLRFCLRW